MPLTLALRFALALVALTLNEARALALRYRVEVCAILNEVEDSNLADIIDDEVEKTVTLTLKKDDGTTGILYTLKGVSFDGESISSSIGSNKSVDLTFSTSVGGPNDTSHGVFMSGSSTTAV